MIESKHFEAELKEFEDGVWAIYSKNNDQLYAKYKVGHGIYFCNPEYLSTIEILKELLSLTYNMYSK